MKALILAAGFGNRLRPITESVPKCLVEVNGTPLLENNLNNLCELGDISEIGIVVGHMADYIKSRVGNEWYGIPIKYFENKRYCNTNCIEEYCKNINDENINKNRTICEIQTEEEKKKEYMLLGLRKIEGIDIQEFKNIFSYYEKINSENDSNDIYILGLCYEKGIGIKSDCVQAIKLYIKAYEMKNKNAMMHLADFMRENYYWEYINERAETWSMRLI